MPPSSQPVGEFRVVYYALSEDTLGTQLLATPMVSGLTVLSGGRTAYFVTSVSAMPENLASRASVACMGVWTALNAR